MYVIARAVTLVEMAVASKVEQVKLIDEAVAFQQIDGAVHSDASNVGIQLLRALEDFVRIEMAACCLHHVKQNAPLPSEPDALRTQLALETPRRLMNVDAFAGRNSMSRCGRHNRIRRGIIPRDEFGVKRASQAKGISIRVPRDKLRASMAMALDSLQNVAIHDESKDG